MGDYLSHPETTKHSDDGEAEGIRYGACGMQGWRKTMEDTHIARIEFTKGMSLFGVFDGHGGHEVAMYCQKHLTSELMKLDSFKKGDFPKALKESFITIDKMMKTTHGRDQLQKMSKMSPLPKSEEKKGSKRVTDPPVYKPTVLNEDDVAMYVGCTACVALITPESIYVANAGDSRAVAAIKRSSYEMSYDHKPENKDERKRIEDASGFVEDNRVNGILNLSRSIGDFEYKSNPKLPDEKQMVTAWPDVREIKRSPDLDFLIIACDGIWDCLTNQQAVDFIYDQRAKAKAVTPLSVSIECLFSKIIAKDTHTSGGIGCDNMTCVVVAFK